MTMIPMNPNTPKLSIRILDGESTSGTVWFRRLKMTFVPQDEAFPPLTPPDFQAPYTKRLQDEPVQRR